MTEELLAYEEGACFMELCLNEMQVRVIMPLFCVFGLSVRLVAFVSSK